MRAVPLAVVAEIVGDFAGDRVDAALNQEVRLCGNAGVDDADGKAFARGQRGTAVEVAQPVGEPQVDRRELDRRARRQRDVELETIPEGLRRVNVETLDLLGRRAEIQPDLTLRVR
jgi:hypothetical protein